MLNIRNFIIISLVVFILFGCSTSGLRDDYFYIRTRNIEQLRITPFENSYCLVLDASNKRLANVFDHVSLCSEDLDYIHSMAEEIRTKSWVEIPIFKLVR